MKGIPLFSLATIFFALLACAPKTGVITPEVEKPSGVIEVPAEKGGWETEWQKALKAARTEGKVVLYGGVVASGLKLHATKLLKDKFGFDFELTPGRAGDLLARISSERRAGLFLPDMFMSGASTIFEYLKPRGFVIPLDPVLMLPEVKDPKGWYGDKLPWADEDHMVLDWAGTVKTPILINTRMVQPGEIKSLQDLLKPEWKGKIVMGDPTGGIGSSINSFISLINHKIVDADFFRYLVKNQDLAISNDLHLQLQWVIRGKYPIGLFLSTGRAVEAIEAGAPIAWLMLPGVGIMGGSASGIAIMKNAPHPNAATIFTNWFLSREGQSLIQKAVDKHSKRTDIPMEGLDPLRVRQPGVKYFLEPTDGEKFVLEELPKYIDLAKEIFAPLLP